ncbi:MAG: hypothetical protein K2I05_08330 [Mailhella sp.]|nr:hypothetical protein [Mailhella sp.]
MNEIVLSEEFIIWLYALKNIRGNILYLLLTGGDKSSQSKDIERALKMLEEMEK